MNKKLLVKNLKELSNICPIEKIQIFNDNLVLIVKPTILKQILLFFFSIFCLENQ